MPLRATDAKKLIRRVLDCGIFIVSPHARDEMNKENLTDLDAVNVLRGGVVQEAEYENGSWRWQVRTTRMSFVVTFEPEVEAVPDQASDLSTMEVVVVTGWRVRS
jgi:hypothetical protein